MDLKKQIKDPLGHEVAVPEALAEDAGWKYEDVMVVISSPAFLINQKGRNLYFFRLVREVTNIMVEVRLLKGRFIARAIMVNPTAEHVSRLLKCGSVLAFSISCEES